MLGHLHLRHLAVSPGYGRSDAGVHQCVLEVSSLNDQRSVFRRSSITLSKQCCMSRELYLVLIDELDDQCNGRLNKFGKNVGNK